MGAAGSYSTTSPETTSKMKRAPGHGFGSASREIIKKNPVPGPGSYAHKDFVGKDGKAFSCTPSRTGTISKGEWPGPGAHEIKTLCGSGPKFSATPRRSELRKPALPGPGAYRHDDDALVQASEKWGFGTSRRPGIAS